MEVINLKKIGTLATFQCSEETLKDLKLQFGNEAKSFYYLRKGEATGAILLAMALIIGFPIIIHFYRTNPKFRKALNSVTNIKDFILEWLNKIAPKRNFIFDYTNEKIIEKTRDKILKYIKPHLRISMLCSGAKNSEGRIAKPFLEKNNAKVVYYINEDNIGSWRMFLNEKRYAYFNREPNGKFFGFIGSDPKIIRKLKKKIEDELFSNEPSKKLLKKR